MDLVQKAMLASAGLAIVFNNGRASDNNLLINMAEKKSWKGAKYERMDLSSRVTDWKISTRLTTAGSPSEAASQAV